MHKLSSVGALAAAGLAASCACGRESGRPAGGGGAGERPHVEPVPPPVNSAPASTILTAGEHGPLTAGEYGDRIYWGTTEEGSGPQVRSVPKAGGSAVTLVTMPRELDVPGALRHGASIDDLFVDETWIFFTVREWESFPDPRGGGPRFEWAGGIYRAPRSGGAAERYRPEGAAGPVPFAADDDFFYFTATDPTGIAIAAVPGRGGPTTMIRLDSPKGPPATVDSIAMGADYWYVSTSSYAGAPSAHCVSRAPRAGGVLEDVWCPSFMVLSLVSVNGMLAGLNPWPWTDDPGPWAVDASGHARAVARSGKDRQSLGLRADPRGRRLYTVERYPGNGIQPATSDLLQFDVGSGQRTVLDHLEDPARHGWFFADAQSVFFTRGGEILRMEP